MHLGTKDFAKDLHYQLTLIFGKCNKRYIHTIQKNEYKPQWGWEGLIYPIARPKVVFAEGKTCTESNIYIETSQRVSLLYYAMLPSHFPNSWHS